MTSLHTLAASTPGLPCQTTDPDLFHSNYARDRRVAAGLCQPCPIRRVCLDYAQESGQRWGVWGGHDFTAVPTYCGTDRGHQIHARNGEAACDPCVAAHAAVLEARRRARLEAEHAAGGSVRGYEIHRRMGEEPCAACRGAMAGRSKMYRDRRREAPEGPRSGWGGCRVAEGAGGAEAGVQPLALAG